MKERRPAFLCTIVSTQSTFHDNERPLLKTTRLAGGQFGLLTRAQARACGMTDGAITYQLRRGWHSVHRGLFLLPGFSPSWEQSVLAACLRGGPGTVASHSTAGALLGLDGCGRGPIHLWSSHQWAAPGVHVHRSRALPDCDRTNVGVIPVTNASRTLLDLGAVCDEEVVEIAVECALRRGMTSIPRLRWRLQEVGGKGRAGSAVLRRLIDLRDPKARPAASVLEVKFLRRIRRSRLPTPTRQLQVDTGTGRRFLDFAWPHARLAVEVGGRGSHSGPAAEQRDSKRHNELTILGWRVLYFTWDDVEHRIEYVVACIERELRPHLRIR